MPAKDYYIMVHILERTIKNKRKENEMNIQEAILQAQHEGKERALPSNEHCENNGYLIRAKPFPNNFKVLEFYGTQKEIDQFSLSPNKMVRNDWMVI